MENREIKHPFWADEEKTKIICQFHYASGEVMEASVMDTDEGNPDWAEIIETFGIEGIDKSTEKYANEQKRVRDQKNAEQKERIETDEAGILFAAKLDAFEIAEVKASKDRTMKARIRKAANFMEVTVLTSILVMKEMDNGETKKTK